MKYVIASTKDDSVKIQAYIAWDNLIYWSDPELDYEINVKIGSICAKHLSSNNESSQAYYELELSFVYNNIGTYYLGVGDYLKSISFFKKNLEISERIGNQKGIVNAYNNLGNAHKHLGDDDKALEYYQKSLVIWDELGDKFGKGTTLNNIGIIFNERSEFKKAEKYFSESLDLFEQINEDEGLGMVKYNYGLLHRYQNNEKEAMKWFQEALDLNRKINYKSRSSGILSQMAMLLNKWGKESEAEGDQAKATAYFIEAEEKAQEAFELGVESESNQDIPYALGALQDAQKGLKKYKEALETGEDYRYYLNQRDSLLNQEEFIRQKFALDYKLQVQKDSLKRVEERKVTSAQLKQEKTQRYALYGGVFILALFGGFIFNRFRKSQAQQAIIQSQKHLVEEKNQEIMDSINYAKRIQAAILPPNKVVESSLGEHFVIYLPKDVVAGDFYWLQNEGNNVLFAAADCTGHGVPGAMVSVVCNNALNRSVKEFGLTDPGKILDKTRSIVIEEFSKSEEEVKDGMDIALCKIQGLSLEYAGANNPLWIIRKGEIMELKGDKQPIGSYDHQKAFTTHTIPLEKGDTVYVFSDGFVDQFGGEKGKKYKAKKLKDFLISIQQLPLAEQKTALTQEFEQWKGEQEQIDDVCVIGVRL